MSVMQMTEMALDQTATVEVTQGDVLGRYRRLQPLPCLLLASHTEKQKLS